MPLEESKSFRIKRDKREEGRAKKKGEGELRRGTERQENGEGLCELIISHWIKTNLMKWGMRACVCACMHVARGLNAGESEACRGGRAILRSKVRV